MHKNNGEKDNASKSLKKIILITNTRNEDNFLRKFSDLFLHCLFFTLMFIRK